MMRELIKKIRFDLNADRLGPDCPFTHWNLYFKSNMLKICKSKFGKFSDSSEFRAGAYAITCSKIFLGENVIIRPNTMLFADPRDEEVGSIVIEDNVMLGSGVHIYVANHKFDENKNIIEQGHYAPKNVILKKGCWIGSNVIILPGVTIGEKSVVAAGSIVTKNIPSRVLFAGNPARLVKEL